MGTETETNRVRAEKRRQRQRVRAERRRADRALVPVTVAQRVGIPVADLARAMRAAGADRQLTVSETSRWLRAPESAPEWFTALFGERMARAAQQEFRRAQAEEQRRLRELAAEQSAQEKVQAGKRRFSDDEWVFVQDWAFRAAKDLVRGGPEAEVPDEQRQVLRVVGVDADDHSTWPVHAGGCDGAGGEHCAGRIEQMRAERRAEALMASVAKETALCGLALSPGRLVTTWHGARVGLVVKVNKVSVKVRMVGGRADRNVVVEKNLDPRYVELAAATLPTPPEPGGEVVLRDHGGHIRRARAVAADGPLFEASYSLKSRQWRSGWFDVAAVGPLEVGSS